MTKLALVNSPVPAVLPTFDLDLIRQQLSEESTYAGWDSNRFDRAVLEYRRFLALCRSYPNFPIGLSEDADRIWHRHILNTRKYAEDCESYFGYFHHHTPIFDSREQTEAQRQTDRFYLEIFGEPRILNYATTCLANGCMNNG